jgi:replicative DNA helicase
MFATALKDLAVELNIFVMTSTQVNAKADDNQNIRNESTLAGSRSIINKADFGAVMARPSKEELEILQPLTTQRGIMPNIVTDIFKVRSGEYNQVRIWSEVDLGNLRKKDLFMTDARMEVIEENGLMLNWEQKNEAEIKAFLKEVEEMR